MTVTGYVPDTLGLIAGDGTQDGPLVVVDSVKQPMFMRSAPTLGVLVVTHALS